MRRANSRKQPRKKREKYYPSENHVTSRETIKALEPDPDPCDFSRFRHGLLSQVRCWRVFSKRDEAVTCSVKQRLPLFCFQHSITNRRYYLVTHPLELLHRCPKDSTHEVVQPDRCKPFAVIEYRFSDHPLLDGDRLTAMLARVLVYAVNSRLRLALTTKNLVILDGSDETTFHRRLVCQLPVNVGVRFGGRFAAEACDLIRRGIKQLGYELLDFSRSELRQFMVDVEEKGMPTALVVKEEVSDLLRVLTRVSEHSEYVPPGVAGESLREELVLLGSFVTPCVSMTVGRHPASSLDVFARNKRARNALAPPQEKGAKSGSSGSFTLDAFVARHLAPCTVDTILRYQQGNVLVFCTREAGFCHNVDRFHKSNRTMWVVLKKRAVFYQKCHDPDCRGFRSKLGALPYHVQASVDSMTDTWQPIIVEIIRRLGNLGFVNPYKRLKVKP